MAFAPNHDWKTYDALAEAHEIVRIRNQTPSERFERYVQLFELVCQARASKDRDVQVEVQRWKEKETIRRKTVSAFLKLDEWKRAKDDSANAS